MVLLFVHQDRHTARQPADGQPDLISIFDTTLLHEDTGGWWKTRTRSRGRRSKKRRRRCRNETHRSKPLTRLHQRDCHLPSRLFHLMWAACYTVLLLSGLPGQQSILSIKKKKRQEKSHFCVYIINAHIQLVNIWMLYVCFLSLCSHRPIDIFLI